MLLETWLAMAGWQRSFLRVLWILLGLLATRGRSTVTSALALFGLTGRWSADFRVFSRSDWDVRACFRGVLYHCAPSAAQEAETEGVGRNVCCRPWGMGGKSTGSAFQPQRLSAPTPR